MSVSKIATHLWFNDKAEEAAKLYTSLFEDSKITRVIKAPEGIPGTKPGSVFIVELKIMGQEYIFLNGGPLFPFNSQVSIYVLCDGQADVDKYWEALTADGGKEVQCGWLTDKFGLSWQIIPKQLEDLLSSKDAEVSKRVTDAMLKMVKIDVAGLERAAKG
ncbi:MAG TPA: VOC family protein [Patescibacteria group bacterium]|nr:VOC family protein [Patescibacteria group bacterium]